MKKIGIITFHRAHNYGAVLQVYALQKKLSQKYETKIIDYRNKELEKSYDVININKKNIKGTIKSLISFIIYHNKILKRYKKFENFINNELNLTKMYNSEKSLQDEPPELDVYITGSDQVWNYNISEKKINAYTLNFGNDNIERISYAASIGTDNLNEQHKEEYINNIKKINAISVREKKAKEYLQKKINREIEVTLDPTLLMTRKEWENSFNLTAKEKERYIFGYTLTDDKSYYEIINYLSEMTGYKIIHVGKRNKGIKNVLRNAYSDGPIEFLKLIKNAEYVVTSSFHATVFSIIFNKKFWVVPPKKTSSRITNLLDKVNLSNRAIRTFDDFKKQKYDEKIDYKKVDNILEHDINKSINWLDNAINIKEN